MGLCCLQLVEMTLNDYTQAELFRDNLVDLKVESVKSPLRVGWLCFGAGLSVRRSKARVGNLKLNFWLKELPHWSTRQLPFEFTLIRNDR